MASMPATLSTAPLVLRRSRVAHLEAVLAAIGTSRAALHHWLPWAATLPTADAERDHLAAAEAAFDADRDWTYGVFEIDGDEFVGSVALHQRVAPEQAEIGYWIRSDRTGRGYATRAVALVVHHAFVHLPDLQHIEIRMDQADGASASVPRKLGFHLDHQEDRPIQAPGHTGKGYVWTMTRDRWRRDAVVVTTSKYALVERERRFLVSELPRTAPWATRSITDLYIEGTHIRLRLSNGLVDGKPELLRKLTQKLPSLNASGGRRGHITTMYLDAAEFDVLARLPGRRLTKQRLSFPPLGVDVFEGSLSGLVLAEAEFGDDETMAAFVPPPWCGTEVTEHPGFTGGNFARIAALPPHDAAIALAALLSSA